MLLNIIIVFIKTSVFSSKKLGAKHFLGILVSSSKINFKKKNQFYILLLDKTILQNYLNYIDLQLPKRHQYLLLTLKIFQEIKFQFLQQLQFF